MIKHKLIDKYFDQEVFNPRVVIWLIILIAIGTFMRLHALDTKAILFGDAGRDLLVAEQALANREVPLLGIPSSVPRFKQGPLSIWYSMVVIALFGHNTYALSISYALLSIAAMIAAYELVCVTVGRRTALLTTLLIATSPLAIAAARMPYHTTPIPLFTVFYLIALYRLWQQKKGSLFWAGLAFALLFQFELALAPLLLVIPFVLWRSNQLKLLISKRIGWLFLGLGVGLLPQIIFDLTHQFAQLGVFVLWVGHKGLEFITFQGAAQSNPFFLINNLSLYLSRVFSTAVWIGLPIIVASTAGLGWLFWRMLKNRNGKSKTLPTLGVTGQIVLAAIGLLFVGYVIHGAPSEEYFGVFTILFPILVALIVFELPWRWKSMAVGILGLVAILNVLFIFRLNFFVSTNQTWSYGPGVGEQKQVLAFIASHNNYREYQLKSPQRYEQEFPSHFSNFTWLAKDIDVPTHSDIGKVYYLSNPADEIPSSYMQKQFQSIILSWLPQRAT